MPDLSTPEKRAALRPRGWPYTWKISRYKYLGYRRLLNGGTWLAKLQTPNMNQPKFERLGDEGDCTYEKALGKALEWFNSGGSETTVPGSKLTLRLVCSQYLTYRHNETEFEGYTSARSLFNCYLFPRPIADKLVTDLKTADYQAWLKAAGDKILKGHKDPDPKERKRKSYYSANMTWHWIESALNRALKTNKGLPKDEWKAVEPLKGGKSRSRPVFLSPDECQRLVNTIEGALRDLVLGGIYTGARLGELKAMRVRDLNLAEGIWTPSHSKTERGHRDRFLDAQTVDLLKRLCAGKSSEALVFTPDGENWRRRYDRGFRQAVQRINLPKGTCFYSLRHSYISKLVAAGVSPLFIAENCGTSVKEIEDTYAKFKPDQKRAMLAQGAIKLDLPESRVVSLR
jgi:integrase